MNIGRAWAMPNKNTFSIKPIAELIRRYNPSNLFSVDPFANQNTLATITNDLDPQYNTDYNLEATEFLGMFDDGSIDLVFFDPPFSPRQVSECYKKLDKTVDMQTTQMSFWRKLKDEVGRVVKVGGIVISCAWCSSGVGKVRGFEIVEILLVAHGGSHNDTIVTVDKKVRQTLEK